MEERKSQSQREFFTWKNPRTGKNHGEKRGCTSFSKKDYISKKDYSGAVISDREFDCFFFSR